MDINFKPTEEKPTYIQCPKCKVTRNADLMANCMICIYEEVKDSAYTRVNKPKKEVVDYSDGGRPMFEYTCACGEKYLSTGHIKACDNCRLFKKLCKKKK